jgi:hypothetical protein
VPVSSTAFAEAIDRLRHNELATKRQRDIGRPEIKGARIQTDNDRIDRECPTRIVHDPDSATIQVLATRTPLENHSWRAIPWDGKVYGVCAYKIGIANQHTVISRVDW